MWFHLVSVPIVCFTILIVTSKLLKKPKTRNQVMSYHATILDTYDKTVKIKFEERTLDSGGGVMHLKTTGQNVILQFQCSVGDE